MMEKNGKSKRGGLLTNVDQTILSIPPTNGMIVLVVQQRKNQVYM